MNGFIHGSEQSDGWFSKIRDDAKKYVEDVRLKSGRSNKKLTLPIGRKVTGECVSFFLKQNTSAGVEKAISMVMTFHAIGRAGEAAQKVDPWAQKDAPWSQDSDPGA